MLIIECIHVRGVAYIILIVWPDAPAWAYQLTYCEGYMVLRFWVQQV